MLIDQLSKDIDMYLSYSNLLDDNHKVIFLSESESDINFLIDVGKEKYIFKLSKASQLGLRNQARYEYDALKILEKAYIAPKTFFLDDSTTFFDYGVIIMQHIDGRAFEYEKDLHEAAKAFGKIHSLKLEKNKEHNFLVRENIIEDCLEKSKLYLKDFFKSHKIETNIKIKINDFLEWAEKNKSCEKFFKKDKWQVINNTEPDASNFIIRDRNKKGYLLDWKKPVICDPSVDVSYFLSKVTTILSSDYTFTEDQKYDFFKTYIMYLDKSDRDIIERVEIYTPYLNLKLLSKYLKYLLEYEENTESINDYRYKRLKQYINIDFIDMVTKKLI